MKFKELVEIISGGTPKTSVDNYWNGNIPWLSVVDFGSCNKYVYQSQKKITEAGLNNSSTKILRSHDIIISARGTVGALATLAVPMAFNQSCFGLRTKKESLLKQDYLYYFLKNYIDNLKKKSQGSVFSTINLDTFDLIDLPIINIKEQNKISYLLDSFDKKIENNDRINDNL